MNKNKNKIIRHVISELSPPYYQNKILYIFILPKLGILLSYNMSILKDSQKKKKKKRRKCNMQKEKKINDKAQAIIFNTQSKPYGQFRTYDSIIFPTATKKKNTF